MLFFLMRNTHKTKDENIMTVCLYLSADPLKHNECLSWCYATEAPESPDVQSSVSPVTRRNSKVWFHCWILCTVSRSQWRPFWLSQQMICIPRLMHFAFLSRQSSVCLHLIKSVHKTQTHALNVLCCLFFRLLPWEANVATYRFMGGDKCLYSFIKTKQQVVTWDSYVKSS